MNMLRNLRLGVKLNLLLLLVIGVLLLVTILLLFFNTGQLTQEIGNERLVEEVNIMRKHLAEIEKSLVVDVNFTASSIPFVQAVGRRNSETVTELIKAANDSLEMDDIDVFDGDGNQLADLAPGNTTSKDILITQALTGKPTIGILNAAFDGKNTLILSAAAPIQSLRQGTVLGAVEMSRKIDDDFLRSLAFERDGVYLGVVYDNQFFARTTKAAASVNNVLYQDIAFDPNLIKTANSGETVIVDHLISSNNVPYTVAYIPLETNRVSPAVLMILVELKEISTFQNNILRNTIIVFAILALVAMSVTYFSLRQIATRPLRTLKTIAQDMTGGQYHQRIPVRGGDEIGQLAETFNEMAEAIQQREKNLQSARAQAERSDQVKSAFLASMSHELRTPLNAIINFTTFVVEGDTGPVLPEQTELLNEVISSAKHLLNLINDVLDMSKIEAGSLTLFIEEGVNLNSILNSIVATGNGLIAGKPVELLLDIDENLAPIRGDKLRIVQVLLNLLSNACKFTAEGSVTIGAHQNGSEIIVSVKDTGPGIRPEDQPLVFEAFKQTSSGLRQGGGTGLGMPIARSLVQAHNGRLWLESDYGKGTTFFVALPIKSEELAPTAA